MRPEKNVILNQTTPGMHSALLQDRPLLRLGILSRDRGLILQDGTPPPACPSRRGLTSRYRVQLYLHTRDHGAVPEGRQERGLPSCPQLTCPNPSPKCTRHAHGHTLPHTWEQGLHLERAFPWAMGSPLSLGVSLLMTPAEGSRRQ